MMNKKLFLIIIAACSVFLLERCYFQGLESVSGNGVVIETERNVPAFRGITVASGIDVFITQGNETGIKIVADENLHDIIETDVSGGMLRVTSLKNIRYARTKEVYVIYEKLNELRVSSAGNIIGENTINAKNLDIRITSAGDIELSLDAEYINVHISSSGDARLFGKVNVLEASLSSAGDLHAFDLESETCRVKVSSSGTARVYATKELDMSASSSGDIIYRGDARIINMNTSSSGDIRRFGN